MISPAATTGLFSLHCQLVDRGLKVERCEGVSTGPSPGFHYCL